MWVFAVRNPHIWRFEHSVSHMIYRKLKIDYISQKNFLDNSYTRFRNRIGLTIGGKFLRERVEVALVWPYKDCYLEGGQTKEEEKRKEIFFNEVLAQDEINRLFDPKVLTNFRRYMVDGEGPVTGFRRDENGVIRENLIIKGNNLLALHTLKTQFRGKVKLIYIDPPYNTGNDSFGYNDRFNHSTWLTFMKNRLEAARTLLREDGSIWINIDDDEAHYLKVLSDEVFGRDNFVANVVWQKKYAAKSDTKFLSESHDHILCYAKNLDFFSVNRLPRTEEQKARYKNPDNDKRGVWTSGDLLRNEVRDYAVFDIVSPSGKVHRPPTGTSWRFTKEKIQELIKENRIWFGQTGENVPRLKRFLSEVSDGVPATTWWSYKIAGHNDEAKKESKVLFDSDLFATPKPERLLQRIIHIATNPGDLVLDFFLGSGTTTAVAHKMGRQYIGIEQMDYIETIPVERLKKVIGKRVQKDGKLFDELAYDQGGISKSVNWQGGGDFIYCELMKLNQVFLERLQNAQDSEDMFDIWQDMTKESFLNWYVNPQMPEEAVRDFAALGRGENGREKQKHLLAELLDKNQLYVNVTEIDDAQFRVSEEDKELNQKFYGEQP